ncbi:MAG: YiiX/YebB-like N1pC/P60 family cysteine hydrolase [Candidatus Eremiobacterota bacterium]
MQISRTKHNTGVVTQKTGQQFKDNYSNDRVDLNRNPSGSILEHDLKLYKKAVEQSADMEYMPLLNDMPSPGALKDAVRKAASSEPVNPEDLASYIDEVRSGRSKTTNPADSDIVLKFNELFDNGMVKPGDIILISMRTNLSIHPLASVLPGKYTHVAVYIGKNKEGIHQSIDAKAHQRTPIRTVDWWPKNYNNWCIISPHKPDGTALTDEERQKVVNFACSAEGCKYNYSWINNKVNLPVVKEKTRFYCSQLAWASYNFTLALNLDPNPGFSPKFAWGVAPQELRDSPLVDIIAEYRTTK